MMPSFSFAFLVAIIASSRSTTVKAHNRLECPPPRSGETGAKFGPCDASDNLTLAAYPLQPNAFNTITWLESISHPGAPGRLALSLEGNDDAESFETCVLLDHIPHDENNIVRKADPFSYKRSSITIYVPDVYCERCHLQLMTIMSDENHGVPANTTCAYPAAQASGMADSSLPGCPVVYHSCAPVSINGTVPRNDATCNTTEFAHKLNWPFIPTSSISGKNDENNNPATYEPSTYYYKGNPGLYNRSDSRLLKGGAPIQSCNNLSYCDPSIFFESIMDVPFDAPYSSLAGSCAAMVTFQVEPFELGVLPSTLKDEPLDNNTTTPPPTEEVDPCITNCKDVAPCFGIACPLRNSTTGIWTGLAAPCTQAGTPCEECFPNSTCYGYGTTAEQEEEEPLQNTTLFETETPTMENTTNTQESKEEEEESSSSEESFEESFEESGSIKLVLSKFGWLLVGWMMTFFCL